MNKNSKQRLEVLRKTTMANQSGVHKGKRIISANPKRNSQKVVYTNSNDNGTVTLTRHEAIDSTRPTRGGGKVARPSSRPPRRA